MKLLSPRLLATCSLASTLALAAVLAPLQLASAKEVWTDAKAADLPKDFRVQGEYVGAVEGGGKLGVQIISLGNGAFQAVVYPGGLPGEGWTGWYGLEKILMDGRLEGDSATFKPTEGPRKYLAQSPEQFSATTDFPPKGQKAWSGTWSADRLSGKTDKGKPFAAERIVRSSPTFGQKAAAGAKILFDGKDTAAWEGGRLDTTAGTLNTDGKDVTTKDKFGSYTLHVEFMLPYRPDARGQGRGNSGVYRSINTRSRCSTPSVWPGEQRVRRHLQKARPKVNMCLPPLTWQTYDIEFTKAETDAAGQEDEERPADAQAQRRAGSREPGTHRPHRRRTQRARRDARRHPAPGPRESAAVPEHLDRGEEVDRCAPRRPVNVALCGLSITFVGLCSPSPDETHETGRVCPPRFN